MNLPISFEDLRLALRQRGWELSERRGGYTAMTAGGSVFLGDLEQVTAWFSALPESWPENIDGNQHK